MPCARLPEQVHSALLPVNADAGAAAWLPLVRAAVRRTQKRLLILFSGASSVFSCRLACSQLLRRHILTSMPQQLNPLHYTSRRPDGVGPALRGAAAAGGNGAGGLRDRWEAAAGVGAAVPHGRVGRPGSGYGPSDAVEARAAQPLSAA